ncbi:MAG: glycosyltransferase family 4 protein [Solirubrobacteraceae bacterium]|nr:glycosyltransferase family 4 protein [Solirubrobacteraceae bacterium]
MPRAVILSPDPDRPSGGVERFAQLLAGALRDGGWETHIAGYGAEPSPLIDRFGLGTAVRSRAAAQAAHELEPDLVVGNNWLGFGVPRKTPHIQVYHGTIAGQTKAAPMDLPAQELFRRRTFQAATEAFAGRHATVVGVSNSTADELRRHYRMKTDAVIGNGVDTAVYTRRDVAAARERFGITGPSVLFVGVAMARKGSDVLAEGAEAGGYELLHAGDRELAGSRALGVLSPDELAQALSAVDAMLFPTRWEACSYAILEAMACGTPVLTTRVGWMEELAARVPAYEPLIIEPTVASIAAGLHRLRAGDHAEAVAQAADIVRTEHDLGTFAARWRELCLRVAGTPDD